ncbi:DUF2726 domain-containing protein [Helicobacter saguini]|uniref:DUF2726 domain-containing protein n=1 Tax=Helicobacter saguini TaxID=1548018 RepID=A0A347VRV6_9HELI|nr:DUF2726 domain-containing protein [Helicobacter saguini]MWV62760.1 DUF2726 domain-containing protein [Helicobacter saguini]MWV66571.1 DUF2726 domain-containing protein [Helicobacter saguini]MWV68920.1 DUF2726 domain-containing protein [Helicobacter saguini]MWV71525.1 DUF2726 domain-containing protein [Helicobacter saguini]TLD93623.1 DUF2726 domain-containing protein [Helicobacter saguini]
MLSKIKSIFSKKDSIESSELIANLQREMYALESKNSELTTQYNNLVKKYNKLLNDSKSLSAEYKDLATKFLDYKKQEQERKQKGRQNAELRRLEQEAQKEFEKSLDYILPLLQDSNIATKELLGFHEFKIYQALIFCESIKKHFIILPQVSFKRFIVDNSENDAWKAFSNFDCDFLLVLKDFKQKTSKPFAIIEYHGGWHYGKEPTNESIENTKKRDKIKEFIAKKTGLKYYVIDYKRVVTKDKPSEINDNLLEIELQKLVDYLYN